MSTNNSSYAIENIKHTLKSKNFCIITLAINILDNLEKHGFAIVENVVDKHECEKLTNSLDEMESEYRKLKNNEFITDAQIQIPNVHLLQPDIFLDKINLPIVMDTAKKILGHPFILSNFNASRSGSKGGSRIHIDSRIPISNFFDTTHLVSMICLDDFTEKNGATIVWPNSHKSGKDPKSENNTKIENGKFASAKRGSIIFTLGQTWHDVGQNIDGNRRWGIISYYTRWWIKPTYDFTKCGPEIFNKLNNEQKELFGFTSIPPSDAFKRYRTVNPVNDLPKDYEDVLSF